MRFPHRSLLVSVLILLLAFCSPVASFAADKNYTHRSAVNIGGKNVPVAYVSIPKADNLNPNLILALNSIGRTESLGSIARRTSAKVAINGSYFQSFDSSALADPFGILIKNGKLIHSEGTGSAIGFTSDGSVKMNIVRSVVTASIGGNGYPVSLVNHTPSVSGNQIVLFTTARGIETHCAIGTSVVVQNGEIISISSRQSVRIPINGYVLVFTGDKAAAAQKMHVGEKASYNVGYINQAGNKLDWSNVRTAVGGGPLLLKDGANVVNPAKEGFSDSAGFGMTVARSAIGVTANGDILLVGGVKCTLNQMASVMSQLGAVNAICMDNGSSSGLYASNGTVPAPAKEISNALIFK